MADVSIIIPLYKPNEALLDIIISKLNSQKFLGNKEIIQINEGWGLAKTLNHGIKSAKYPIIVTIHQDCMPSSDEWLETLIKPLHSNNIVACTSDVKDIESSKIYTPLLDEKGCAYKKVALEKVNYFDEKVFLNSGEDMDMYLKLKRIGDIAYPHSCVEHYHPGYLKAEGYKRLQNANTWGTLFRVHGLRLNGWYKGLILANIFNWKYFYWFWRGFLLKKQDFKR